jgi:hypothetical protein
MAPEPQICDATAPPKPGASHDRQLIRWSIGNRFLVLLAT